MAELGGCRGSVLEEGEGEWQREAWQWSAKAGQQVRLGVAELHELIESVFKLHGALSGGRRGSDEGRGRRGGGAQRVMVGVMWKW